MQTLPSLGVSQTGRRAQKKQADDAKIAKHTRAPHHQQHKQATQTISTPAPIPAPMRLHARKHTRPHASPRIHTRAYTHAHTRPREHTPTRAYTRANVARGGVPPYLRNKAAAPRALAANAFEKAVLTKCNECIVRLVWCCLCNAFSE